MPDMILPPAGANGIYAMLQTARQQGRAGALAAYRSAAQRASPESDLGFAWFCSPSGSIRAQKTASGFHAGPECLYSPATKKTDRAGYVMRWVIALFVALLSIPVAQVAADAWNDRAGPQFSVRPMQAAVAIWPSHGTFICAYMIPLRRGSTVPAEPKPAECAGPALWLKHRTA
jgi:hypothetical protein